MPNFRPILLVLGLLVATIGVGMLLPAAVDAAVDNPDWRVFFAASAVTTFIGVGVVLANRGTDDALNRRQAFLLTTLAWVIVPAFAALPFMFSDLRLSFTDAYFEAMSGITTTGSTVISGLDHAPPGILLWRALLQWLGGIGIVVMAVAVLPMLQVGGMQLFRMESSDTSEKILPRAASIAGALTGLYVGLSALCMLALMAAGLSAFDAMAHAMTTIATGGFSTSDGSIGSFDSVAVDSIVILFMLLGSLPFVLFLQVLRGRPMMLWRDGQVRAFAGFVVVLVTLVTLWLITFKDFSPGGALRYGAFNVISVMTGTGFSSTDYGQWGAFSISGFFLIMFIGGCAGSTSCGVKIFRFQVLFSTMATWVRALNRPHGVFVAHYNNRPIPDAVIGSVMSFLFLFLVCFMALAVALSVTGLDYVTALSGAGTALANVGPGLGEVIGPAGTFGPLPDTAKWLLSLGMLLGRLELFTVLVLLTPTFWRG